MKLHLPVKLFRAVLACMAAFSFVSFTSATSTCYAASEEEEEENDLLMLLSEPEYPNGSITYTTRQTSAQTLTGYESILFKDINSTSSGGAIYNDRNAFFTLCGNGNITFSGNTHDNYGSSFSYGGAICNDGTFTLSGNREVTFSGNSLFSFDVDSDVGISSYGSAIYNNRNATFTLSGNGDVVFSGNTASSDDVDDTSSSGGAIFNDWNAFFTLSGNGSVTFSGNSSSSSAIASDYTSLSEGGAICNDGTFTLCGNEDVIFSENTASSSDADGSSSSGGAIDNGGTFTLSDNGAVTFSENSAGSYSGNDYDNAGQGGAIYNSGGGTFTLSGNGDVSFNGNSAFSSSSHPYFARGGAIANGGTFTLSGNEDVSFCGNSAFSSYSSSYIYHACGGAIFNDWNAFFTLCGNGDVTFSENSVSSSYSSSASESSEGGAIHNRSTFTLSDNGNVTFSRNSASSYTDNDNVIGGIGGAIANNRNATFTLSGNGDVSFIENLARGSGAIFNDDFAAFTLCDNASVTFSGNTASDTIGGAIYNYTNATFTLSGNGGVTFSGNTAPDTGGAIYNYSTFTLSDNGDVSFSGNTTAWYGGAIFNVWNAFFTLCGNEAVTFSGNSAFTSFSYGGAICNGDPSSAYSQGSTFSLCNNVSVTFSGNSATYGAIYNDRDASFTLRDNENVTFIGNSALDGGAIYNERGTFTLSGNGDVSFSGNTASSSISANLRNSRGGAIINVAASPASGNATFMLSGNGTVTFSGNSASTSGPSRGYSAYGGAIYNASLYASLNATFTLSGNGAVTFSGNFVSSPAFSPYLDPSYAYGGAIYNHSNSSFTLSGNGNVLFEKNYENHNSTYHLRSIYSEGTLNLASLEGKSIIFRDSLYASGTVNLNQDYTDSEGVVHKSTGDIILTGATTEADLREVKGGIDGTAEEILNSRTSEIATMTNLYGGRLIVEDKAILKGQGITAAADSGAKVRVKDGSLNHSGYELTFNTGTTLEAEGVNAVTASSVDMLAGSTLSFVLGEANLTTAALTLTGTLTTETISIAISGLDESEPGHDTYALLSATTYDTSAWTADKITVVTEGVSFENLVWKDGTLYLNYIPDLTAATWTNASGDGLWNASSLNWTQDGHSYAYADGVDVIFGNEGAGTVSLVGNLVPKSVLVDNGSGFDYTFAGTGKLTGTTALTKQGAGKLTINTANDYTGGTAINGGTLVVGNAAALGTGAVAVNGGTLEIAANGFANDTSFAGTSALVVDAGYQLALSKMLANSGVLTVSGTLNASSLTLNTTAATHVDVNGNSGASGFAKGALYSVQVVNGGTTSGSAATITHLNLPTGETLVLGSDGVATAGGAIDYSEYLLTGSDTVSSSAIHGVEGAANATVTQTGGTLTVDDTVTVNGTGGAITLNGGTLNGSLQGMTIDAVAGTLAATLAGNNTLIGHDFALNAPLDNQGTLVLNGSFDLSGMTPTTSAPTHIDVNGNSGASGFAKTELQEVTIATGGTINASGATFTHNGHTLTLGEGGVASVGGEVDYGNYLLTGSDTASSSAIHGVGGAANATVTQNGGTLTVDDTVTVATTAGTIVLNGGALNGTVSGATINAASGALNATLSGNNTLNGNNYALGSVIANQGTLTVSGTFDVSALTLNTTAATHIDVNGASGANGFAKDAFYAVTMAHGTTVDNGASITHGEHVLTLGSDGVATAGGAVDYGTYFLHNGAEVAVSAIRTIPEAAEAKVDMDGGKLAADADVSVTATGGRIEVSHGAAVAGSIRDTQIAIHGCEISADITGSSSVYVDGDTILSGHNTYTGNTEVHEGGYLTVSGSITSDVYLYAGTLDTATGMTLVGGQDIFFRGGQVKGNMATASGSGLNLNQDSTLDGSLTLGGGTLTLSNGAVLTVSGSLTLAAPTQLVGDWAPNTVYTLAETGGITDNSGTASLNEFFSVSDNVGTVKQEGTRLILDTLQQIKPDAADIAVVNSLWGSLSSIRDFARLVEQQHLIGTPGQTTLWAGAFGSFTDVSMQHGFTANSGGYAVGVQHAFTQKFRGGFAVGQSMGTVESKGAERVKNDQQGMMAALSLQYEQLQAGKNSFLFNSYAAVGKVENDAKGAVQSTWDDTVLSLGARASYAFACGQSSWVMPFAGLEWNSVQQGNITRADGTRYTDGELNLLSLPVGVTLRSDITLASGAVVAPELTLAYEANLVKDTPQNTCRKGTKSCTVEGYDPGEQSFMLNASLNVLFNEHWSAGASYTIRTAEHSANQSVNASVRYMF